MTLRADSQLLEPGSRVRLYEIDGTGIDPAAGQLFFHGHEGSGIIYWKGQPYQPWPIEATGFDRTSDRPPTPTLTAANLDGSLTAMCTLFDDMVGAILTVRSTLTKYLDEENFVDGNPTADPTEEFFPEIWIIDRKEHETHETVKWALSSALDHNGATLPGRLILANLCGFQYRQEGCMYAGPPVAKLDDTPTSDPLLDKCSRKPSGCKIRFGENNPLPYGGFPAAGLMR